MMSTILIIALILASAILLVLIMPFHVLTEFALSAEAGRGAFLAHWIHPRIIGIRYDFGRNLAVLTVFGRRLKSKARDADVKEKSAKPAGSGGEPGTVKKEPVRTKPAPAEPSRQTIKPAMPAGEARPESSASIAGDEKTDSPRQSTRSRFAQFRTRMVSHWQRLMASWRILQRHHLAYRSFRWCMRLLTLSLRVVRFDHLRITVQAGMEDPAELGKIYGWFTAGTGLLSGGRENIALRFEPQFMRNSMAINGSVGLHTSAARVLMPLVVGLLTFPWLRAFFVWRRLKTIYQSEPPGDIIT